MFLKQNAPALSYAATKNINRAAYVTEVLKMAFCWCGLPCSVSPLNASCLCSTSRRHQQQPILCPAVRALAGRGAI